MNRLSKYITIAFTSCVFICAQISAEERPQKLKKTPNIAINISRHKKIPHRTYLNLGLLSNFNYLNGLGVNVISSITLWNTTGLQFAGFANVTGMNVKGLQFSGIANVTGKNTYGINTSGLMNINGKNSYGILVSGLGNISGESNYGLMVSGLINMTGEKSNGIMLSGLANISGNEQRGFIRSGLANVSATSLKGLQMSALLNTAGESNCGLQLAALGNVSVKNKGMQTALFNYAAQNNGIQIGMVNVNKEECRGVQLGIVNISKNEKARQIGFFNIKPYTRPQLILSGGNTSKLNVLVQLKNKYTYTQVGLGTYYLGFDKKFSATGIYRIGVYHTLLPKLEISADMGYYHIETFKNKDNGYAARMYALQPRINLEYRIMKKLGIFVSGGYNWTRNYSHSGNFDKKVCFETGIVLF